MSAERELNEQIWELPIQTRDGEFVAQYSQKGLRSLTFPRKQGYRARLPNGAPIPLEIQRWHEQTTKALVDTLSGQPIKDFPPLDLSSGTDFQQRVWRVLKKIACGKTLSYGEVADEIGDRKAVRAVGRACGANPIPVLIPCHRVLASKQKIGGFSGGLDWKRKLLTREGVLLLE
jgi:O-6-methylguanine DNA methyltransferase